MVCILATLVPTLDYLFFFPTTRPPAEPAVSVHVRGPAQENVPSHSWLHSSYRLRLLRSRACRSRAASCARSVGDLPLLPLNDNFRDLISTTSKIKTHAAKIISVLLYLFIEYTFYTNIIIFLPSGTAARRRA